MVFGLTGHPGVSVLEVAVLGSMSDSGTVITLHRHTVVFTVQDQQVKLGSATHIHVQVR